MERRLQHSWLERKTRYARRRLRRAQRRWLLTSPARALYDRRVRHVAGPEVAPGTSEEPVVLCVLRDGEPWLGDFLEHYERLGAAHVVLLDNGSRDATVEIARRSGATVLHSDLPFAHFKQFMRHHLIRRFGLERWSLLVDIDELFDFPGPKGARLPDLARYLDSRGYDAVVAQMLDLFPDGPLSLEADRPTAGFRSRHVFYDHGELSRGEYSFENKEGGVSHPIHFGGVRRRFGLHRVMLTKHPMLRLRARGGLRLLDSSHAIAGAHLADLSGVLLHYKFVGRAHERLDRVVAERSYANDSHEPRRVLDALDTDPALALRGPKSKRLEDLQDLVNDGFLVASPAFEAWWHAEARHPGAG